MRHEIRKTPINVCSSRSLITERLLVSVNVRMRYNMLTFTQSITYLHITHCTIHNLTHRRVRVHTEEELKETPPI